MTFLQYVSLLTLLVTEHKSLRKSLQTVKLFPKFSGGKSNTVSKSSILLASADTEEKRIVCDNEYRVSAGDSFEFIYSGAYITDPCILKLREDDDLYGSRICVAITQKGDLCGGVKVEYHSHFYTSLPDKEIDCSTSSSDVYEEYCPYSSRMDVALVDGTDINWSSPLKIKVYLKSSSSLDFSDVPSIVKTSVYLVIGIVVGCIVIMIILVVVVIVCCCRRQRSSAGTVYRSPPMALATTTTQATCPAAYPPQQQQYIPPQGGYQPQGYPSQTGYPPGQQTGYPPQQQAGYHPQQQTGYPPQQQASYPPAAQQGYAGYQTASASEKSPMASAPPMEMYPMKSMEPPPYPGN